MDVTMIGVGRPPAVGALMSRRHNFARQAVLAAFPIGLGASGGAFLPLVAGIGFFCAIMRARDAMLHRSRDRRASH